MKELRIMVYVTVKPTTLYHKGMKSLKGPSKIQPILGVTSPRLAFTSKSKIAVLKN
jgi:hypothetical protein